MGGILDPDRTLTQTGSGIGPGSDLDLTPF